MADVARGIGDGRGGTASDVESGPMGREGVVVWTAVVEEPAVGMGAGRGVAKLAEIAEEEILFICIPPPPVKAERCVLPPPLPPIRNSYKRGNAVEDATGEDEGVGSAGVVPVAPVFPPPPLPPPREGKEEEGSGGGGDALVVGCGDMVDIVALEGALLPIHEGGAARVWWVVVLIVRHAMVMGIVRRRPATRLGGEEEEEEATAEERATPKRSS